MKIKKVLVLQKDISKLIKNVGYYRKGMRLGERKRYTYRTELCAEAHKDTLLAWV